MSARTVPVLTPEEELVELREQYDELNREHIRQRDIAARKRREHSEWEKRVRSAARRLWESERENAGKLWMQNWVGRAQGPFTEVLYRIEQLGERPKRTQIDDLRAAAGSAAHAIKLYTENGPTANEQDVRNRAEVTRLRDYVLAAGRSIHAEHGWTPDGPTDVGCTCPGCELVVGMDLVDDEAPA